MIRLTFCGVRGSCPTADPEKMEYGGNTACVSLRAGGVRIFCDAGTGILSAAEEIRVEPTPVHIFLSHMHLDHICALPLFLSALPKKIPVHVWGMSAEGCRPFGETLQHILCPPVWPVTLKQICPQLVFHDMAAGEKRIFADTMAVTPFPAGHPDGTANFRFELDGRTVFYGLDCEITPERFPDYIKEAENADVILFDGTYTAEDYKSCRGFGHSSMALAPDVLRETAAGQLWLLHYDVRYTDVFLREQEKRLCAEDPSVHFAREGVSIVL